MTEASINAVLQDPFWRDFLSFPSEGQDADQAAMMTDSAQEPVLESQG